MFQVYVLCPFKASQQPLSVMTLMCILLLRKMRFKVQDQTIYKCLELKFKPQ